MENINWEKSNLELIQNYTMNDITAYVDDRNKVIFKIVSKEAQTKSVVQNEREV